MKVNVEVFDFETIDNFDNHISDSILGYEMLHDLIVNITGFFINKDSTIMDLGCTTGKLLIKINNKYGIKGIGYDITDVNFLKPKNKKVTLLKRDITDSNFYLEKADVICSIFTLQFLKYHDRLPIIKKVYESLTPNGVFIVCEKEICKDGIIQEVFTFSNYENKRKSFTEEEILNKEQSLRMSMNSLNAEENKRLFISAGFTIVEPFFQSLNFKGYILRK